MGIITPRLPNEQREEEQWSDAPRGSGNRRWRSVVDHPNRCKSALASFPPAKRLPRAVWAKGGAGDAALGGQA